MPAQKLCDGNVSENERAPAQSEVKLKAMNGAQSEYSEDEKSDCSERCGAETLLSSNKRKKATR